MFPLYLLLTFNGESNSNVPWAEHLANTQNTITTAHFLAITLNECDYVVTAGILISYAFKWTWKVAWNLSSVSVQLKKWNMPLTISIDELENAMKKKWYMRGVVPVASPCRANDEKAPAIDSLEWYIARLDEPELRRVLAAADPLVVPPIPEFQRTRGASAENQKNAMLCQKLCKKIILEIQIKNI